MLILRQSTAIDIRIGPFVDATDGVTPETGVTLAAADQAEVLKEDGQSTATMAGTFAAVTGADGWYDYTASVADTSQVGEVVFVVQDLTLCLPSFTRAMVVEEVVYDAVFASGASGYAAVGDLGTVQTGDSFGRIGAAGVGLTNLGASGNDWNTVEPDAAGVAPTAAEIKAEVDTALSDYDGPTNTEMVAAFTEIKGASWATTDSLEAIRDRGDAEWTTGAGGSSPSAADIRAEIDSNSTQLALIVADTGELQTDWVNGGRLDLLLDGASSAGDPWGTTIPGSYGAGTAGKIVGDNLDAAVSSISAGSGLTASQTRDALGLTSANLDTQLAAATTATGFATNAKQNSMETTLNAAATSSEIAALDDVVDTVKAETVLILQDTDATLPSTLATIAGYIDSEIGTIIANLGTVDTIVDDIQTQIGTAGVGLTDIGTIATVTTVTNEVTADVTKISGDATAADNLEASLETMVVGTATGGTTASVTSAVTGHGDDTFIGRVMIFRTGVLQYEAGAITDYDSVAGTFTFAASTWTTTPAGTFVIV